MEGAKETKKVSNECYSYLVKTEADTCSGDGGGPIMCPTDRYFTDYKGESIPIYEQAGLNLNNIIH